MMKIFFRIIFNIGIVFLLSQNPHDLVGQTDTFFHEANQLYQEGNYSAAIETYQNILDTGYEGGSIYYNMGNCYYKMQNIGYAILYYERAKRLIPGDEDLKSNLTLANLAVVDKINPQPEFIIFRAIQWFIHFFKQSTLFIIVAAFYLITVFSLVVWIISKKMILRKMGYRLSILFGILFFIFGLSLIGSVKESTTRIEAIVLVEKVDVLSAPGEEGIEVFSLHEGTKVRIDHTTAEWVRIILSDGKVGWVQQKILGII